jgi:hypothetical protein
VFVGKQHDHAKNGLNRKIFCWESDSTWVNLNTRVDTIGHFLKQKSNAQEVKFACFHGASLKRRAEQADKFCIQSNYLRAPDKW